MDIEIRLMQPEDSAFVIATWLHHYKKNSYFAKRIRHSIYFRWHRQIVGRILEKPQTRVYIAHPTGEPEIILGFLVVESRPEYPIIHFTFVKEELRRLGIARKLVEFSQIDFEGAHFTHWTFIMTDIAEAHPGLIHNPYEI